MKSARYPLLKMLIPYLFGIFFAYFGDFPLENGLFLLVAILTLSTFAVPLFHFMHYNRQWVPSVLLYFSSFFLGFGLTNFHFSPRFTEKDKQMLEQSCWRVQLLDPPVPKERSVKAVVKMWPLYSCKPFPAKSILYLRKDSAAIKLQCGDQLLVKVRWASIEAPKNPYAFDNQLFMRRKGVWFTGFVETDNWQKVGEKWSVRKEAAHLQKFFSNQFAAAGLKGDEYAIITAILLGDDDTMEPELKASYASAGVSHILCVSGMHVGIIFMILDFLLKPLNFGKNSRRLKSVLLLLAIWFYAYVTGLSPSVKRAAAMFTFVAVGGLLRRNTDIFHSLSASLFVMLLLNPLLIFEVGLQLSYAAVVGIVVLQPKLLAVWTPKNRIINYFWNLATVSIAAQATTFPIAVYCFGQFPNYFLLSNLTVIFLSFVIVISGVATLAVSFWPWLLKVCGWLLCHEIKLMNLIIRSIESIPGALTENISLHFSQVWVLYVLIFCFYLFFVKKKKSYLFATGICFAIFLFISDFQQIASKDKHEIILYCLNHSSAMGFNSGGNGILLADTSLTAQSTSYRFSIQNHARQGRIRYELLPFEQDYENEDLWKKGNAIWYCGQRFFILDRTTTCYPQKQRAEVDYLLLRANPRSNPAQVAATLNFKIVVADASNSNHCIKKWQQWCMENDRDFYNIKRQGSLSILSHPKKRVSIFYDIF